MKNMYQRFMAWLLLAQTEAFNPIAKDGDKDGLVQEGTPFERKVTTVKKAAAPKKKAPVKKTAPKKTTAKKTVAKKTAPKKK